MFVGIRRRFLQHQPEDLRQMLVAGVIEGNKKVLKGYEMCPMVESE